MKSEPAFAMCMGDPSSQATLIQSGMTLRDYFAAKAMQSLLQTGDKVIVKEIGRYSYAVADEMLKEREK